LNHTDWTRLKTRRERCPFTLDWKKNPREREETMMPSLKISNKMEGRLLTREKPSSHLHSWPLLQWDWLPCLIDRDVNH
jgi:hypothetical protein